MKEIQKKIIDGVKETLENIKDGKKLVELELEVQRLRKENKKLISLLKESEETLTLVSEKATQCKKQINLKGLT